MRKYYMDNLRWIIIFLLIPYHAAMAWNAWGGPNYIYFGSNNVISSIIVFFSPYFMPLMFLLAGMSTRFALQRRTLSQYV
ncbi:MAG: acyltransferase family protein, partial [Lachnospiraceae bacterium]|nr:acyltransferase family protein [Lachnospiraceae bacterium]